MTIDPPTQYLNEKSIRGGMDLILFVNRVHIQLIAGWLSDEGLGMAHYRCLNMICRCPDTPVSKMIDLLEVSKQSFSRVLADLVERGLVEQKVGKLDRRQRNLFLTQEGKLIEKRLTDVLYENMRKAYSVSGERAVQGFWLLMQNLMSTGSRVNFVDIQKRAGGERAASCCG